jgi:hypothetical protein
VDLRSRPVRDERRGEEEDSRWAEAAWSVEPVVGREMQLIAAAVDGWVQPVGP